MLYRNKFPQPIPDDFQRSGLAVAMERIGFVQNKSRHFRHPECEHLFIEFPPGPLELGGGRTIRLLSPTDCVKDRLAAYIHWKRRVGFDQALLVCRRKMNRVNLQVVKRWCEREGGAAAFEEFLQSLKDIEHNSHP